MTSTTAPALPDTPAELLRAVRDLKKTADRADIEMMRLAVHWADLHLADPEFAEACFTSPKTFAGEGSPAIDEFCVPEFATMLGRTNDSAGRVPHRLRRARLPPPPPVGRGPERAWWRGGGPG